MSEDQEAKEHAVEQEPVAGSAEATVDAPVTESTPATPGTDPAPPTDDTGEAAGAAAGAASDKAPDAPAPAAPSKPRVRNPTLVRAFRTGRPIEGTILRVIKGGYEVKVGRSRGFCPHSQVDLQREDNPERQLGKEYLFRVMQLRRGGEDVVLSRRAILEADRAEEAKAVRATLVEGSVTQGRVAGTAEFGAFIDLGAGVMGLSHISELSHTRISRVEEAVKIGDTVRVRVLKVDDAKGRISLSVRRAVEDPWARAEEKFVVGRVYPGTVQRVADFGAFVEMAPGVEALAPASEFPPAGSGWQEGLDPGTSREWYVLSVAPKARRMSVTLPGDSAEVVEVEAGKEIKGRVQRIERYGVFAWLCPGKVGLVPREWTGKEPGADLRRAFKIGDEIEVSVVEVTEGGKRIRLAVKGVDITPEETPKAPRRGRGRDTARAEQPVEETSTFGTSLADKLRAALEQSKPGS